MHVCYVYINTYIYTHTDTHAQSRRSSSASCLEPGLAAARQSGTRLKVTDSVRGFEVSLVFWGGSCGVAVGACFDVELGKLALRVRVRVGDEGCEGWAQSTFCNMMWSITDHHPIINLHDASDFGPRNCIAASPDPFRFRASVLKFAVHGLGSVASRLHGLLVPTSPD